VVLVQVVSFLLAWCAAALMQARNNNRPNHSIDTRLQMIVAASCGTKNNNASLQSNNYGQLNHTDGKSYCSVSYLEERLIADSSCIGLLGNNIDIDFRHRARVCVCVYAYVYVREHIHTRTKRAREPLQYLHTSCIDVWLVVLEGFLLLAWCACAHCSKQEKTAPQNQFQTMSFR